MTTIFVWFLITMSRQDHGIVNYSPPMPTLSECERVQKVVNSSGDGYSRFNRCIQMEIVVTK